MSRIRFGVYKTPGKKTNEQLECARLISYGTKKLNEICSYISECSSVSSSDIKGVLEALTVYIGKELAHGYNVELEGLGNFSPSLSSKQKTDTQGKGVISVGINGVNFRCSKRLKELVNKERPIKVKRDNVPTFNLAERKAQMLSYMEEQSNINQTDYAHLNHCTQYQAGKDIQQFLADGIISSIGYKTHRIYVPATPKNEAENSNK
ncbi:MAG: HU family DNA-binding protein [Tannerellaceae bacterium]